jgi:hypothetical protein
VFLFDIEFVHFVYVTKFQPFCLRVCHIAAKTSRYCKAQMNLRSALGSTLSLARFNAEAIGRSAMRKVSEYERQAAECRKLAAKMKTPEQRKQMEEMADVWDRLARERRVGIVDNKHDQTQSQTEK